jgi:hypothetical protein
MGNGTHFFDGIESISLEEIEEIKTLPLSHNCQFQQMLEILTDKTIKASNCKRFKGEELAYFFYGKPTYFSENDFLPVFLLFEFIDSIDEEHRIAPFDTGAYLAGYLDEVERDNPDEIGKGASLNAFCYHSESGKDSIEFGKKVISHFFSTNRNYYKNLINAQVEHKSLPSAYFKTIVQGKLFKEGYDSRSSSIEIQFKKDVDITRNKIIYALVPDEILDLAEDKLKGLNPNIKIEVYSSHEFGFHKDGVKELVNRAKFDVENFLNDNDYF